ncbi:hypothetical protein NDU88_000078 [Pleurodeles waltl]|uniref:Uncharacterized protein n=1 Tax=Pleurodeles waltl TaxID=8319 RepID=A0AAV7VWC9_PLEWA|nr:hypothetical protein NDU88_000078 [Pleurodeles waltl]
MLAGPGPSPAAPSVPPTPLAGASSEVNKEAARRPPRKLITSFYQKVDKAPLLEQTIKEEKEKEGLGAQGGALETNDNDNDNDNNDGVDGDGESHECLERDSERASEKRAVKSTKFILAGPLEIAPVDEEAKVVEEKTWRKSCHMLKSQLSVPGSPVLGRLGCRSRVQRRASCDVLFEPRLQGCPASELLPSSSESAYRRDRSDGNQRGKNDYLSESSLMFLDYTLPDIQCSLALTKNDIGPCEPSSARLASGDSLAEAALDFKFTNNSSSPSGVFWLTDSIYQHLSPCSHQRTNPVPTESPQGFMISEAMIALKYILASILALLEKFLGVSEHIESLLTTILQTLVPSDRTEGRTRTFFISLPGMLDIASPTSPSPQGVLCRCKL